jgi:hypothetical protein
MELETVGAALQEGKLSELPLRRGRERPTKEGAGIGQEPGFVESKPKSQYHARSWPGSGNPGVRGGSAATAGLPHTHTHTHTHTHALTDFGQTGHQDPEGHEVGCLHFVPLPAEERQAWRRLVSRPRLLGGLFGCSRPRQGQPEQGQCGAQHPAACLTALPAPHGRRPRVAAAAYRTPPRHRHVGPAPPNRGSDPPKPGPDSETQPRTPVVAIPSSIASRLVPAPEIP